MSTTETFHTTMVGTDEYLVRCVVDGMFTTYTAWEPVSEGSHWDVMPFLGRARGDVAQRAFPAGSVSNGLRSAFCTVSEAMAYRVIAVAFPDVRGSHDSGRIIVEGA